MALLLGLLLAGGPGCATVQSLTNAALGRTPPEVRARELQMREERVQRLTDAQVERQLAFIIDQLDEGKLHAAAWQYGWLFVNAAGGGSAIGLAAFGDSDDLALNVMRAVKGAIGVVYLSLDPQPGRHGAEPITSMPSATPEDRRAQLVAAEELLAATAERSRQRFSWAYHLGNFFFNGAAAGAVAAAGEHDNAIQAFLVDFTVGEIQVWTQPWNPPSQWEAYQRFVEEDTGAAAAHVPEVRWAVGAHGAGVGVRVRF